MGLVVRAFSIAASGKTKGSDRFSRITSPVSASRIWTEHCQGRPKAMAYGATIKRRLSRPSPQIACRAWKGKELSRQIQTVRQSLRKMTFDEESAIRL